MNKLFYTLALLLLLFYQSNAQQAMRLQGEATADFLFRISDGKYISGQVTTDPFNTPGEKIIYLYNTVVTDTAETRFRNNLQVFRLVVLMQDTLHPMHYHSIDLELDTDRGYGIGLESVAMKKSRREKYLSLSVFHLMPGPGRVRTKGYENYELRQRRNNAGFFNDFELIRLK